MPTIDAANLVRQTLLVGFVGTEAAAVTPFIRKWRPGGVALLPRNVVSVNQLADLTSGLQEAARAEGMPPLLIAVDQEGGAVARLASAAGFTDLPGAMSVGLTRNVSAARDLAAMVGRELAGVGVNLDLAPVVDLALDPANTVIGSRSFGSDPALVSDMAAAWVDGLRSSGVLACAKHFPGHGATSIDSHLALPRLHATAQELEERDFIPFRGAIAAGCAAIMTAHVRSPLDPKLPATLSRTTLTDVVRDRLGFEGLVLTDALEMKALAEVRIPRWRAGAEALRAGADMLIFEGDVELIEQSVSWIERAIERDELDSRLLEASNRRLANAREAFRAPSGDLGSVGSPEHWTLATRIAADGISAVDPNGSLPLSRPPVVLDLGPGRSFAEAVAWSLAQLCDIDPGQGPVAIVAEDEDLSAETRAAIERCGESGRPVVVIVVGGWTVPADLPASTATILGYDLPRGLWSVIAQRVSHPRNDGAPVGKSIQP